MSQQLFASDHISPEKQALINTLLQQTTQTDQAISELLIDDYLSQIKQVLKQSPSDISPEQLNLIETEVINIVKQEVFIKKRFSQLVYPIYDRYLTNDDLQQMIAFNQTELGKKLLRVMPLIALANREVRSELALDLAPQINERLVELLKQ